MSTSDDEAKQAGSQLLALLEERHPDLADRLADLLELPLWMTRSRLFDLAAALLKTTHDAQTRSWAERLAAVCDPQLVDTPFMQQVRELIAGLKTIEQHHLAEEIVSALAGSTGSEVRGAMTAVLSRISKQTDVSIHLRELAARLAQQTRL